jgi:hypothetical protein
VPSRPEISRPDGFGVGTIRVARRSVLPAQQPFIAARGVNDGTNKPVVLKVPLRTQCLCGYFVATIPKATEDPRYHRLTQNERFSTGGSEWLTLKIIFSTTQTKMHFGTGFWCYRWSAKKRSERGEMTETTEKNENSKSPAQQSDEAKRWTELESDFLNRWMNRDLTKRWEKYLLDKSPQE